MNATKHEGEGFLKFIIIYKAVMGFVELFLSAGIISFIDRNMEEVFKGMAVYLRLDPENQAINSFIKYAGNFNNGTLVTATIILLSFGVMNLLEAWGLHKRKRWAEWLTVIATSLLIPFEIYAVKQSVSVTKVVILVLNIAIVYYLARNKKLFERKKAPAPDFGNIQE